MSRQVEKQELPKGWGWIKEGDIVEFGDLYNYNHRNKNEPAEWTPYKSSIGTIYNGWIKAIHRVDLDAPMPENYVNNSGGIIYNQTPIIAAKTRVEEYLKKIAEKTLTEAKS
jgi:hypothetical protein